MRRFNPQPPRRTAATSPSGAGPTRSMFQSSAAPKDGCYKAKQAQMFSAQWFQSSAAPKDGCYRQATGRPRS